MPVTRMGWDGEKGHTFFSGTQATSCWCESNETLDGIVPVLKL